MEINPVAGGSVRHLDCVGLHDSDRAIVGKDDVIRAEALREEIAENHGQYEQGDEKRAERLEGRFPSKRHSYIGKREGDRNFYRYFRT